MLWKFVLNCGNAFFGFLQGIFNNSGIGEGAEGWVGTFQTAFWQFMDAVPFKF